MRQTSTVTLPVSGMIAEIVTSWTFGEYEKISRATQSLARMNADSRIVSFDGGTQSDDRVALGLAIVKLLGKDGVEIPVTPQAIDDLDFRDGKALLVAINQIGKDEKKG